MDAPYSCDTFVALPPSTSHGAVIFGKNSDRPRHEVQEVVFRPAADHKTETLQCTYISIPQASHTHAVILSKPAWMWGAEMGSNEHGVCVGNEAVSTKLQGDDDLEERLLGMDLVRLGLERSSSAKEAVDVITQLLEEYGQGGPCTDIQPPVSYHNSFLVADTTEAWVLETAGRHWAAEKVTEGVRNISNQLSIGEHPTRISKGLLDLCQEKGWWNPESGPFDFARVMTRDMPRTGIIVVSASMFSANEAPAKRYAAGKNLMEKHAEGGTFCAASMMRILRDQESSICRVGTGARNIASTGSQVSVLFSDKTCFHWFTGTPNPACSAFKPCLFPDTSLNQSEKPSENPSSHNVPTEPHSFANTTSPTYENDPARQKPRFTFTVDRSHALHRAHATLKPLPGDGVDGGRLERALGWERENLEAMEGVITGERTMTKEELARWWDSAVEKEMRAYSEEEGRS